MHIADIVEVAVGPLTLALTLTLTLALALNPSPDPDPNLSPILTLILTRQSS